MMDDKKEENETLMILLLVVGGLVGICGIYIIPNVEWAILSFGLGLGLTVLGVAVALNFIRISEKELKRNKRGALWIWAVCLLAIVTLAIGWFALTWPAFLIIEEIEAAYDFPAEVTPAISLIKTVMGWFLILMTLGLLLWAYVTSQRKESISYPID